MFENLSVPQQLALGFLGGLSSLIQFQVNGERQWAAADVISRQMPLMKPAEQVGVIAGLAAPFAITYWLLKK